MKTKITIDELIEVYGPVIRSLPSGKPRDPVERALLARLGDPMVARESDGLIRTAGQRMTPQNSGRKA